MPNYVESFTFGPLSYHIEKNRKEYRLWLNGCRIGRPRPDKPASEVWEYHANSIRDARSAMKQDAKERIESRIADAEAQIKEMRTVLRRIGQ